MGMQHDLTIKNRGFTAPFSLGETRVSQLAMFHGTLNGHDQQVRNPAAYRMPTGPGLDD